MEYVIFVEGKADKKEYGKLVSRFYKDEYEKTLFININGVTNIEASLNLQILSHSDLKYNCLIIRDSDGRDNNDALEKTVKELMKTVGTYYREEELKEMIYCTEESMIECLTMYPIYCNGNWDENIFYKEYHNFLMENKELIYKSMRTDGSILEKIYDGEYNQNSLSFFRKYGVNKNIYNLFKKRTRGFKGIGNIEDEEECRELVHLLLEKLDRLFKKHTAYV